MSCLMKMQRLRHFWRRFLDIKREMDGRSGWVARLGARRVLLTYADGSPLPIAVDQRRRLGGVTVALMGECVLGAGREAHGSVATGS